MNKIYAGIHYKTRLLHKANVLDSVESYCHPRKTIKKYPVTIHYSWHFASKPLDTLNTAYVAKMIEDCLREIDVIKDDDIRYVRKSDLEVSESITNKDWLEIIIQPYETKSKSNV
jgi:hypothetical protein